MFMLLMMMSATVCAVCIAFNLLDLKHKRANRPCLFSVVLFFVGLMVNNAAIGINHASDGMHPLGGLPGRIAFGIFIAAALLATYGIFQIRRRRRHQQYKCGWKRGLATLIASLAFVIAYLYAANLHNHPRLPAKKDLRKGEITPARLIDPDPKPAPDPETSPKSTGSDSLD
jgi:hypothetical protein